MKSFDNQQLRGVDTLSITAQDGRGLSAVECDSTRLIEGVSTAGGRLNAQQATALQTPDTPLTIHSVTPGYIGILFPSEREIWNSRTVSANQISKELGLKAGSALVLSGTGTHSAASTSLLTIQSTAERVSRIDGLNRGIMIAAAPSGYVDECLVAALAGHGTIVAQGLRGWFSTSDVRVQPMIMPSQLEVDPELCLQNRWSKWTWLIGGSALIVLSGSIWWSRRNEIALYAFLAFSRTDLLFMILFEVSLLVLAPAQFGASIALSLLVLGSDMVALTSVFSDDLRFLLLTSLAVPVSFLLTCSHKPLETIKGR